METTWNDIIERIKELQEDLDDKKQIIENLENQIEELEFRLSCRCNNVID